MVPHTETSLALCPPHPPPPAQPQVASNVHGSAKNTADKAKDTADKAAGQVTGTLMDY